MIKKVLIACAVAVFFAVGFYLAAAPLLAEWCFTKAVRMENLGYQKAATEECEKAVRFDPLNAKYRAGMGRLYIKEGRRSRARGAWENALKAYEEARRLSPTNARYYLGWAEAKSFFLLNMKNIPGEELAEYLDALKKAMELDPNGYYVNAFASYYMLLFRSRLDRKDLNFAIYRLRHSLDLNPRYANDIYSTLANRLNSFDLLQKITPNTPAWQARLFDFMRNIDYWKYKSQEALS